MSATKVSEWLEINEQAKIRVIHGRKYPDNWNRVRWRIVFEKFNIFVMTSQIFLNILRKGMIKL